MKILPLENYICFVLRKLYHFYEKNKVKNLIAMPWNIDEVDKQLVKLLSYQFRSSSPQI